jgi:hypothetical protein
VLVTTERKTTPKTKKDQDTKKLKNKKRRCGIEE